MIDFKMGVNAIENSLEEVCTIIDKQICVSMNKSLDRIVKLLVKDIISSESSNYNSSEILAHIKRQEIQEVKEIARSQAINYLKRNGSDKFE